MKKLTSLLLILCLQWPILLIAQIYEPDGLRMPGDWNGWANTTGMGGVFDLQKVQSGTPRWQTTFQYSGATGSLQFKFVSTSFSDPWGNQWAGNSAITMNGFSAVTYGTPSDPNNQVSVMQNKWYTVIFEDNGYANARCTFMQTSSEPVQITGVSHQPVMATPADAVTVTAQLSVNPSPEEKFYLRYSINGWSSTAILPMTITGNTASAIIPAQPNDTTVSYYVLSTVIANPQTDFDLISIRLNNNGGQNFSYTVGESITCGHGVNLVTTDPAFTQESLPVTIYFNAELGNGGLYNYSGDIYAHTGVITNLSTSNTDWKYVKTDWGQNTPETKLLKLEANLYSLQIDNIRQYYGVPATEQIKKLAFVFRGGEPYPAGNYPEHKNADGSDIMVEVYLPSLLVKILNPSARDPLASPNTVLPVCVEALQNQSITLYLDEQLLTTASTSSLAYPLVLQGFSHGTYWIKAVAAGNTGQARDSVSIYLRGPVATEPLPTGVQSGINYIDNNTVTLVLHDPAGLKNFAFAIGEFSNWLPNDQNYMKRTPDGKYFWTTITGLTNQAEYTYQYFIDGKLKIADPYSDKILDPWNDRWIPKFNYPSLKPYPYDKTTGTVSVFQTGQTPYNWEVTTFTPPAIEGTQQDLFVYELLLRDFTDSSSLITAMEKLDYLKNLGVNAIELMPVNEFDGNISWGYAPNFFFASDKFYGTKNQYKKFIDECHKRGIAVILDIVTNHCFGQCPLAMMYFDPNTGSGQPSSQNPWLNPQSPHPLSVGYDFNHESPYTRDFFKRVLTYWLTEYKVDGYRFDLSKGLTQKYTGSDLGAWSQYDQGRINILNDYYNHIKSVKPKAYVILEHFAENNEETVLANSGMMLWSAMHERYKQVGTGWQNNSDISWAYHANRGWSYPNLIDYMENHDEERMMFEALKYGNSAGSYNLKDSSNALNHMRMTAAMMFGIPGPKMVWQFGELGYDYSIQFNGDRTAPKPPRWDYLNRTERQLLYHTYSAMARLRKSDAFRYGAYTSDLGGKGKRMWIAHNSMNVVVSGNMDVALLTMAPGFNNAGTWYDYFSGQQVNVTDPAGQTFTFAPGEFRVFTSIPLPKPYHEVTVVVKDSTTGAPISGAEITFENSGIQRTDLQGKAGFVLFPGNNVVKVTKATYSQVNRTLNIGASGEISILMKKTAGAMDEPDQNLLKIYPNPAENLVTIEADRLYNVTLLSADGRFLQSLKMKSLKETMNLTGFQQGMYILRLTDGELVFSRKLFVGHP